MKNLGIYSRMLVLIAFTGVVFLLLLAFLFFLTQKQEKIMIRESGEQFTNEVNSLITMKTATIRQVVYDYTYWDDFVAHLTAGDSVWYANNITTILKTYRFDYVCVYDTSFNLLHEAVSNDDVEREFITVDVLLKLHKNRFLN